MRTVDRAALAPRLVWVGIAALALVVWALASRGLWEGPFVVAVLWALWAPSARIRFGGALAAGAVGYAIPLALAAAQGPAGAAAGEAATIMGFGHAGVLVWLLTAVLALAQAAAGAWLGHAARRLASVA